MIIETRSHLFPCRTQKLSSSSLKILGRQRPGKIGCRRLKQGIDHDTLYAPLAQMVEQLTLNQWVLGSSPRWCTTYQNSSKIIIHLTCSQESELASHLYLILSSYFDMHKELLRNSPKSFNIATFEQTGPLVKRLRLRPLTPASGVRFSHGSPRLGEEGTSLNSFGLVSFFRIMDH